MNKKQLAAIISAALAVAAAVAAIIVFRAQIASFFEGLRAKRTQAQPSFTPEEREAFADI